MTHPTSTPEDADDLSFEDRLSIELSYCMVAALPCSETQRRITAMFDERDRKSRLLSPAIGADPAPENDEKLAEILGLRLCFSQLMSEVRIVQNSAIVPLETWNAVQKRIREPMLAGYAMDEMVRLRTLTASQATETVTRDGVIEECAREVQRVINSVHPSSGVAPQLVLSFLHKAKDNIRALMLP
ncbi:hypothetical protein UFOVP1623_54 [uncultured Caudovirales phage]|uniref:Uncharacterized protein n=1 Tax=uncultured Caudovirales phage TaxID=2100421 RepID=A0A6J5SZB2_9CAUD|nr:hypothetical protein UFOVP1376_9 [uncultured Caudovirales phage]CAB4220873.1 hypothetical protein UFOVP1623_54 [uncultured Caudovirales phage]